MGFTATEARATATCASSLVREPFVGHGEEPMTRMASRAMTRARAGDRDALSFLYARYADEVYGRARKIFDDHDTALDITRRVFANLGCPPDLGGQPRAKSPGSLRHALGAIDD